MITADQEGLHSCFCQTTQKIIQQISGSLTGNGFVIHIPGDQYCIYRPFPDHCKHLIQYIFLISDQVKISQGFAQMQISQMQKSHVYSPLSKKWL